MSVERQRERAMNPSLLVMWVAYLVIGFVLGSMGATPAHWQFWAVMLLATVIQIAQYVRNQLWTEEL